MSNLKYQHIIWDWNGTLLDDVLECISVVNVLLEKRGLPVLTLDRYRRDVEFPIINFYRQLGFTFKNESYDEVAHEYMASYIEKVAHCRLQRDAAEVLARLTHAGFSHSLLSAYHQQRLEEAVEHFGLTDRFIGMIGLNDYYAHGKVENGKRWLKELPYPPDQVLFIGDMIHDFEVSQAMRVDCVLLSCGHQSTERLAECQVPLFDSLSEVADWLIH